MKLANRTMALAALVVGASAAHASLTYNIINASVTYNNGDVENLANNQNGPDNQSIDFFNTTSPIFVASVNTARKSGTVNITYEVTSTSAINALNLVFTGWNMGTGQINYTEHVETLGGDDLADVGGNLTAGSPFVQVDDLTFSHAEHSYRVTKTFDLSIDQQSNTPSFSTIGLIEQNATAVPEPTSMAVLGIGAVGALVRRRRK